MKAYEKCNDCDFSPCSQCSLRVDCDLYNEAIMYDGFNKVR